MTRLNLHAGLIVGAALAASMTLAGAALAAPRDNDAAVSPPAAINHSDADDSSRSMANSNGPSSTDRDTGLDRAQDRMSQEGLEHSQAQARNSDHDADDRGAARDRDDDSRVARNHSDRDADQDRDASRDR